MKWGDAVHTKGEYKEGILKLMIENKNVPVEEIKAAYYQEEGEYLVKTFKGKFENAEKIIDNFNRLGPEMFKEGDWEAALLFIADKCQKNNITWFLTGSACDAVRGIDLMPHDLDIEIYSKHWNKTEEVFADYIVEPFIYTEGWAREHFGRITANNIQIDMVADCKYDLLNYDYEPYVWKGYTLWLEPFMTRYRTEIQRQRLDRIEAFKRFFAKQGIEIKK